MNPGIKAFISPSTATTPQLDELEGKKCSPSNDLNQTYRNFKSHGMQPPRISLIGVYLPILDPLRYNAFVATEVASQNPINFCDETKDLLVRLGRGLEIVALSPEELIERREYFEQEFAGVAQIEVLVENPDADFSVSDFQQIDPSVPGSFWQVAWNEKFLTADGSQGVDAYGPDGLPVTQKYRVAFFIHSWRQALGLNTSYGPLPMLEPVPIPERLWLLAPFELVD